MVVDSLTGTLTMNGTYTVGLTYAPIALTFVDDVGLTTIGGSLAFARQANGASCTEQAEVFPSQPLSIDEDGLLTTITSCSLGITSAGSRSLGAAGDSVVFELEGIPGTMTLTVISPVAGVDPFSPDNGELLIEAEDGSSVKVTVAYGDVVLSVDTDGDGVSDGTLAGTWDELD